MAITLVDGGAWATVSGTSMATVIPGTPQPGDRLILLAGWKDYSITATVPGWTQDGSWADGTVPQAVNAGSVRVEAWHRDYQTGDTAPTVSFSGSVNVGSGVMQLWRKGGYDEWDAPTFRTAGWASGSGSLDASATADIKDGAAVLSMLSLCAMCNTMTVANSGTGVTWDGAHVQAPASHHNTSSGNDFASNSGYRMVTTGGNGVTPAIAATLSGSRAGSVMWLIQSVTTTTPASVTRPIPRKPNYGALHEL